MSGVLVEPHLERVRFLFFEMYRCVIKLSDYFPLPHGLFHMQCSDALVALVLGLFTIAVTALLTLKSPLKAKLKAKLLR